MSCGIRINAVADPPRIEVICAGRRCGAEVPVPRLAAEMTPTIEGLLKKCGGAWRLLRTLKLKLPPYPAAAARVGEATAVMLRLLLAVKVRKSWERKLEKPRGL